MAQLELRRALKAKSASEERLGLALNASGFVGIWEWDIVRDRVYADEQFVAAFGGEPHWSTLGAPIADYVKAIHPDDLGGISVAIQQALHPGGAIFQQEYRLLQKDGSVRWIEARGRCNFDAGGNPVRFPGVAVDITARKASQREALDLADRYRFVTNSMPHKIATANASGKLDFVNQEWMEYTGLSSRRLIESGCLEAIHPDDAGERLKRWKQSITETKSFRWHHAKVVPKHNAHGELSMWIWSDVDVDELRRTRRR
jgi:PAS domain S-box-containing protein